MRRTIAASVACLLMLCAAPGVFADLNQFAGKWENVDAKTRGLTRLEISVAGTKVKVHAYGDCEPSDCDLGEVDGVAYAPNVDANLTETAQAITVSYAHRDELMVIRPLEGNRLQVETYRRFSEQGRGGRADYTAVYTFVRSK